jgi:hypothetical protein
MNANPMMSSVRMFADASGCRAVPSSAAAIARPWPSAPAKAATATANPVAITRPKR